MPRQFWPSLAAFVAVGFLSLYLVSLGSPLLSVAAVSGLAVFGLMLIAHTLRRFADSERRYRHLLNTANDGIIAIDPGDGHIIGCNAKFSTLTGRGEAELIGRLYRDLFPLGERDQLADTDGRMLDGLMQLHLLHRDGRLTPVEVSASYTLWDESEALIIILRDVTERRAHERRIEYLASHDSLTGLANRREFESVANELLHERRGRGHALLYLDLDQFKVVNDTCGHAAGDELLRQLTSRLRRGIRDSDTLARLGGDEFGVLLVDCTLPQAEQIASKLVAGVNDWHFTWGEKQFTIGVSIGVVPLESGGAGLAALLSAADAACYAAKEAGRNRTVVYRPGDSALVARQDEMDWVARLTDALAEDRLELYCQRIVDSAALVGARYEHWELLLRLRERDGTLVAPGRFLPAAERFNLAPSIDRRVIQRALGGIKRALASGASGEGVYAVNLSGATVCDPDFGSYVEEAFRLSGVPPAMVCFEMTETSAIASIDATRMFIARMHQLGSRIALDDFGSGMSSFAYLRALSVDYLKIDGMFVRDLPGDPVSVAMVRAIYELSRAIGVRTVAEFIETDAAYEHVQKLGGDLAQGFALHRPEPWRWDPSHPD
ncbi:MAG: putative bifunctional diguanylate cyclase/phosphodiesterase [Gammaproteobacteria bacterium]